MAPRQHTAAPAGHERRRRLVAPLATAAGTLAAVATTVAVGAIFTDSDSSGGNQFTTGTIDLTTSPTSALLTLAPMLPGDVVVDDLTVTNAGASALRYAAEVSTDDDVLGSQLTATVWEEAAEADGDAACAATPPATGLAGPAALRPTENGRLAFTSNRDGNLEIYVMNADGTNQTRITSNAAIDLEPAWSPDGTRLAFTSNRDGNFEIYVMNADGTNQTRITNHSGTDQHPSWSPDGSTIVFSTNRDGNEEIYVVADDGTGVRRLTDATGRDRYPRWSPDGSTIAFQSDRTGNYEIFTMDVWGRGQVNLTNEPTIDELPSWSPDGSRIAFRGRRSGDDVWLMDASGANPTRLTTNAAGDFDPAWSPDGQQVAFSSNRDGHNEVYRIAVDGSAETRLVGSAALDSQPTWERVAPAAGWAPLFGSSAQGADAGDRVLAAGAGEILCFRVELPLAVGNSYETRSTVASFRFTAEQTAGNP